MRGKEKCKALKEIRRQIAEKNDIPYVVSQCTYQGECRGTCPKCESELRYLERELAVRQGLGKAVAVVGISASVCAGLTACSPADALKEALGIETGVQTSGEIAPGDISEGTPTRTEGETGERQTCEGESAEAGRAEETGVNETDESLPEESEETEELLMGEIMPSEEQLDERISELAGNIPLPEDPEGDISLPEDPEEMP